MKVKLERKISYEASSPCRIVYATCEGFPNAGIALCYEQRNDPYLYEWKTLERNAIISLARFMSWSDTHKDKVSDILMAIIQENL